MPNDIWHCDGYDKMKPFGHSLCSWWVFKESPVASCCKIKNNPVVPAALYLRAVEEHGVCPTLLKTDCGSENADMAGFQCYLTNTFS